MGEVGPSAKWRALEQGKWSAELFDAFRRAKGARQRFLLGELIWLNEPLVKLLVGQLRGKNSARSKGVRFYGRASRMRVIGADALEWEDAFNAGRVALAKALPRWDPERASLAVYLKNKIYYELQCLVQKSGVVTVERDAPAPALEYFEDDEHCARVTGALAILNGDDEELEPPDVEATYTPVDQAPAPSPPDTRTALEVLLEEHCRFARHARCAASALQGRYADLAHTRGEFVTERALVQALREREVRATRVRVGWNAWPVRGFAGVCLQSAQTTR